MEVDYVEKDPSGRFIRYPEILGKGAFKKVYKHSTNTKELKLLGTG